MALRTMVVIPKEDLSLSQVGAYKNAAVAKGVERALARGLAATESELICRHAENIADFGTALDQWNTAALAVVGTEYSVFQAIAAPALANNRVAVFYGCGIETVPNPVSLLNFRQGAAGGTTYAIYDTEQLVNGLRQEGYFSEPIWYDPVEVLRITVTARIATLVLARVQLFCYIIEPKGPVVSR